MKMMILSSLLMAAALLAGCAPKTIYYWGDYQEQIYSYYKQSGDPLKQIDALSLDVEKARAAGQPVPPGLHAQLGLLYAKTGDTNEAFGQLDAEKQLFPESAPNMDFLMSKNKEWYGEKMDCPERRADGAVADRLCAAKKPYDYTAFRASKPASILVLPAANTSPDINAAHSLNSLVTRPLAEAGYYVFPVAVVEETFQQNGLTSASDAQAVSAKRLNEIFHADCALYISISDYGSSYRVIDSVTTVTAKARLVDLRSGKEIWQGSANATDND